ncbi:putative aminophospholipid-translocase [Friedmanniomyces endolithicus]|nr:putative aminophospholipid-translocase [Friedmanniomyces endolithicus]
MNSANAYHEPPTPDPYADDDDDELDLNELDPVATSRRAPVSHDYGLPLRPLRYGGRRRPREADTEDLGALIDGGDEARRDPGYGEEHEGLLPTANGSARRLSLDPGDSRARRKGISRFLSFTTTTPTSIALPSPTSDSDATTSRIVHVAAPKQTAPHTKYPPNTISNAKYTPWSFLPRTLWNEFKFFFNLYFLLVALSQIVPALRIGYLSTYVAPLAFVVSVTVGKEAVDDLGRRRRDRLANEEGYRVLRLVEGEDEVGGVTGGNKRKVGKTEARKRGKRRRVEGEGGGRVAEAEREEEMVEGLEMPSTRVTEVVKASKDLKVGDVIVLGKDERLPADVVILKSFSTEQITPAAMIETAEVESDTTLVETNDSPSSAPVNETTSDDPSAGGEAFIRTDQLDGETDWKLRLASPLVQNLPASEYGRLRVTAGKPDSKVNEFAGTIELLPKPRIHGQPYDPPIVKPSTRTSSHQAPLDPPSQEPKSSPLNIDNTAWANTVLASPTTVHALILYTGPQTRSALSTSASRSKTGLLEHEINSLTKILCALTATLSLVLVLLETFASPPTTSPTSDASGKGQKWFVAFTRFLILFSTIVPISLRVNLDMGKSVYAFLIQRDTGIPGTVVRTSTIPEDLGRVEFLLTDKTGTLTRNEMVMRRVHVGSVGYGGAEGMEEVGGIVGQVFGGGEGGRGGGGLWTPGQVGLGSGGGGQGATRTRREIGARVRDLVVALAVCHNVTPTVEEDAEGRQSTAYQASSPDEVAIVQWTEAVGLRLAHRDRRSISLQSTRDGRVVIKAEVLHVFPFTSDSKRMGIVVRFLRHTTNDRKRAAERHDAAAEDDGGIAFFQKGADTVMASIVAANDWLDEETGNMAREGLRTLVIGCKSLSTTQYAAFSSAYTAAALTLSNRDAGMARVVKQHLETNLDLLGVTGVEDKLQPNVKSSLELLRNAGIKIWMLTGDKVETARCIAISSKLVPRNQPIHTITNLSTPSTALSALEPLHANPANTALLIDGSSLATYLTHHPRAFILTALTLPCLIASRCSPSQKAALATLIRAHSPSSHGARIAAIGDNPTTNASTFDYTATNFGLINRTYPSTDGLTANLTQWQKFEAQVNALNAAAPLNTAYKVLFMGRHGEGVHNAAESYYGTPAWNCYWAELNGNATNEWFDADLTPNGIKQALIAHDFWAHEIAVQKIPYPQSYYTSPLTRCLKTANYTFAGLEFPKYYPFVPTVRELLREGISIHTCDHRRSRTYIHNLFPTWNIDPSLTEYDQIWNVVTAETNAAQDARSKIVLDSIFSSDDHTWISITSHSGEIGSILRVLGHQSFSLSTGAVIPVLVKAEF